MGRRYAASLRPEFAGKHVRNATDQEFEQSRTVDRAPTRRAQAGHFETLGRVVGFSDALPDARGKLTVRDARRERKLEQDAEIMWPQRQG
jgi:hypothetical protein